jgi:2-polyprenyl-3-methyl-5-hydroxy-6-metoxy-1,4-benzoquinol methylase
MKEISVEEIKKIWNENAFFWDEKVGQEGNDFHRILIEPAQEKLLELKEGEYILDIACGNGQFARKMADRGVRVFAFDMAENFIARAKERSKDYGDRIHYSVIDVTDREKMDNLGEITFDKAVCTMAIMDMVSIEPMIVALRKVLKKGGTFVFSICHPCFNSAKMKRIIEEEDRDGEMVTTYSVSMSQYITSSPLKGLGMLGQPAVQYYFHRSISEIFNLFFKQGFMLNGIEEPVFPENKIKKLLWKVNTEIPAALVVRMILSDR